MFYAEKPEKEKKTVDTVQNPGECWIYYMNVENVKLLMCLWIDDVCWYNSNETNNALSRERQLPFHNFVYELEILFIVFYLARSNAMAPPLNAH